MEQKTVTLSLEALAKLRKVDERLVSYNIEMAEVTGGTFWKTYTPGQIAGTEEFAYTGGAGSFESTEESEELMEVCPPINLYNEKLRYLAKELGPVWVRVAGGWANRTYYDFDGHTGGVVPEGYLNILTKEQWTGVLDFVKAVHGKLLISCANCDGLHKAEEPWNPSQAEIIFSFSKEYGVPIDAVEFTNEPNAMDAAGMPKGYTPAYYRRDHDLFFSWLKEHYPDVLRVGPCTLGGDVKLVAMVNLPPNGGTVYEVPCCKTEELLDGTKEPLDVFSCHYYNGVSERIEKQMPGGHWHADQAMSEAYFDWTTNAINVYSGLKDRFVPGGQMWVTEAGDAGGGGNTWASTYLDVFRTLNELGSFAAITDGVIFHNTLCASDYGFLHPKTYDPRPNYFAVLLWNQLMGTEVYDAGNAEEMKHVFIHSRRDGKPGKACLILNTSESGFLSVKLPSQAAQYTLSADYLRSTEMRLNGVLMKLTEAGTLPAFKPVVHPSGELVLAPATCTFLVFDE